MIDESYEARVSIVFSLCQGCDTVLIDTREAGFLI